jgi:16S rRNA (uracil1498-N3)-methyltransferase
MAVTKLDWFYVESFPDKGAVALSSEESRHVKVKRHHEDEKIALFDGKGRVGVGKLISKDKVMIEKVESVADDSFLSVAVAIPKGEKADFLIQKLTELNVKTIIPLKSRFAVVLPSKTDRLKRIAIEACKQAKRAWIPEIKSLTNFADVLKLKADVKAILDQEGRSLQATKKSTLVLVGPEGGFSEEEIAQAEKAGFTKASVGKNVLRIETAAIAAAVIIGNQ